MHCQDYIAYLNPGQTTVSCGDQPLYALKKSLIWAHPEKFLKPYPMSYVPDVFAFFGALHLEQVFLVCTGEVVKGTGLEDLLSSYGLKTVGLSTAVCDVNHIKKSRYSGQVLASVLNTLLVDAHKEAMSLGDSTEDFEKWKTQQHGDSFEYFYGLLTHLLNVNLFVRSIREASFDLFVASLEELCPLLLALDHIHYSRWVPVFIHDLKLLKASDPTLYEHFHKGFFAARKTDTDFSRIAYDHVHEQNNKITKSRAGFATLLNKEESSFLRKMENVLPEIHSHLDLLEGTGGKKKHKETMSSFAGQYIKDCNSVYRKISSNPFLETVPKRINTTVPMPAVVVADMRKVFRLGHDLYRVYVNTRFVTGKEDVINSKISKNFLKLPRHSAEHTIVNPVCELKPSTIVKLRGACTQRPDLAHQLFAAEFTGAPECLVKDGQALHGTKSQILKCIEPAAPSRSTNIDFQTYVVDVSVEVRSKAAILSGNIAMSYRDFIVTILNSIASKARESPNAQQIDLVIDFYHKFSIKSGVRTERERAARALFELVDPLPKNFQELFMTNDEFKTDLYNYFSDVDVVKS